MAADAKRLECRECGRTFSTSAGMHAHAEAAHWPARGKVMCPVKGCSMGQMQLGQMLDHLCTGHTRELLYACGNCGKQTATSGAISQHEAKCRDPLYQVCGRCGRFTR